MVKEAGFNAGFVMLSAIAVLAALFFALAMPETIPSDRPAPCDSSGVTPNADRHYDLVRTL